MIQAVLFDLDGTLLDTLPDIYYPLNETLSSFGYPVCTREQVRRYIGAGTRKLIERALPEGVENADEIYAAFRSSYGGTSHARTKPYPGIGELLLSLKERGVKLAVVSNKPQEAATTAIQTFFPGLFSFVQGDSGDFPCKPDPTAARYCALTLHVPLKECVFVGDGETDVAIARNAGMRGVSVLWGYRDREELAREGATLFAETPELLGKILMNF